MGKRRRSFSETKYEINLESKDKVLIRQEKKSPIRKFLLLTLTVAAITLLTLLIAGILFNAASTFFFPSSIAISLRHNTQNSRLSATELERFNVYLDGRAKPLPKKVLADGVAVKFRRTGQHIIGIENRNSYVDSVAFWHARHRLDSLALFGQKHYSSAMFRDFTHFSVVSEHDFEKTRFLSSVNRQPWSRKPLLFFVSDHDQPAILVDDVTTGPRLQNGTALAYSFIGNLHNILLDYTTHVDHFSMEQRRSLHDSYAIDLPQLNPFSWFSDNVRSDRYQYAAEMQRTLNCAILLVPYIYKDAGGNVFTKMILALSGIGVVEFEPIEIRNMPLPASEILSHDAPIFSIIQAYLNLYESFVLSRHLDESLLSVYMSVCNSYTPHVDSIDRIGDRIVRTAVVPQTTSIVYTLDDFFAKIAQMQCLELYQELADFWENDPYALQKVGQFNRQEREVVLAIVKWSLALKENEHKCAENNWPNKEQRLALFTTMKGVIDRTASLAWLQNEVLYGVLVNEINKLNQSQ